MIDGWIEKMYNIILTLIHLLVHLLTCSLTYLLKIHSVIGIWSTEMIFENEKDI